MLGGRKVTTLGGDKFRDEYSLAFDGTDDIIETTLPGSTFDGDFTISAWVKNVNNDVYRSIVAHHIDSNNFIQMYIIKNSAAHANKAAVNITVGGTAYYTTGATEFFTEDKWFHVVFTQDDGSNTQTLYVDAVSDASTTRDIDMDFDGTTRIGRLSTSSGHIYTGNISEIAIYNTALSASQVKTLYNGREPYNHKEGVASGSLAAWYRMGDGRLDNVSTLGVTNSDIKTFVITDEVTPTLGEEKYTATNALAKLNNAQAQTDIDQVYEGGVSITSGTAQTDAGLSGGRYAMHIQSSASSDRFSVDLDDYLTKGKVYVLSCVAKHSGSGDASTLRITDSGNLDTSGDYIDIEILETSETGWAYYGIVFEHTSSAAAQGSTEWFGMRESGGSNNAEFWVSELSIKEVGGNAGVMYNMTIDDFVGDKP